MIQQFFDMHRFIKTSSVKTQRCKRSGKVFCLADLKCLVKTTLTLVLCMSLCTPVVAEAKEMTSQSFVPNTMTDEELAAFLETSFQDTSDDPILFQETKAFEQTELFRAAHAADAMDGIAIYAGADRYDTSAQQARAGWVSSTSAIVASGEGWVDALAASGLAGALDCPLLLTEKNRLSTHTASVLSDLGISEVIVVGGANSVSEAVTADLFAQGISKVRRLSGSSRYATQQAIYDYGVQNHLWSGEGLIVASGDAGAFADVLSAAPLAFARKMPVFLTTPEGSLSFETKAALIAQGNEGSVGAAVVVGGERRVSERTLGFLDAVAFTATQEGESAVRLSGDNRYETSAAVVTYAREKGWLSGQGAAFASGHAPYDSLGGGVLQGKRGSVLLLVAEGHTRAATAALADEQGLSEVSFFGGPASLSDETRAEILAELGLGPVTYRDYAITLDQMATLEATASNVSKEEVLTYLDPSTVSWGDDEFYQYAVLSDGYSGKVTAEQMNALIDARVVYMEESYGVTSQFRGHGQDFIDAAKEWNVNEMYLFCHAAVESAWGCSYLARGGAEGRYFNFFGIGAYDSDPNNATRFAEQQGWDTVRKAIMGSAEWIASGIGGSGGYLQKHDQNTLYTMRWNVSQAVHEQAVWHQYATALTWSVTIARLMASCYRFVGIYSLNESGLSFVVPRYAEH